MGERADAVPEAAVAWLIERADEFGLDPEGAAEAADDLGRAVAAAAPLLPGGGEAERLRSLLREVAAWIDYMERPGPLAQESRRKIAEVLSAQPDAERAPQEVRGQSLADIACPVCGFTDCKGREPRPQGDEVETVARAMWDARETKDPSGERIGCTEDDQAREPVFWDQAVAEDRWPGSRREQLDEARLILNMLGRPLDARSGADTVKRSDVVRWIVNLAEQGYLADWVRQDFEREFASGADRPEGSQT